MSQGAFARDMMTMRVAVCTTALILLATSAFGQQNAERQTVIVGPWSIATTYKADKFDNCTMSRSVSGLGIVFVRNEDGLLLTLDSPKSVVAHAKLIFTDR